MLNVPMRNKCDNALQCSRCQKNPKTPKKDPKSLPGAPRAAMPGLGTAWAQQGGLRAALGPPRGFWGQSLTLGSPEGASVGSGVLAGNLRGSNAMDWFVHCTSLTDSVLFDSLCPFSLLFFSSFVEKSSCRIPLGFSLTNLGAVGNFYL